MLPLRQSYEQIYRAVSDKVRLADAGNTVVPACLTLRQRGYAVRCDQPNTSQELWYAESETAYVIAEDVLSRLALTAIAESRGAEWRATDEQIESFLREYGVGKSDA